MSEGRYYWFSAEELQRLSEALTVAEDADHLEALRAELQVSSIRSGTVGIPVLKLQSALGLEKGSQPLWLLPDEHALVQILLRS